MAKVVHFDNPFDPLQRRVHLVRKPTTVRRLLRLRGLRRHTSVRRLPRGGYGFGNVRAREFVRPTACLLNGKALLRSQWGKTIVGPHDVVTFATSLKGGGGSKNPLGIILAIAVAVAAPYLAPMIGGALVAAGIGTAATFAAGSLGLGLLTAATGLVLSAAAGGLMSLFAGPAPAPSSAGYATSPSMAATAGVSPTTSPTFSIGAQGNTARLGQPIPELIGRHQVYPDWAMFPYARYVDNEQYLHTLLVVTRGECEIEAVRIGDTPSDSFEEIEWNKIEPGELGDPDVCDPRFLPCRDLATVLLPDSTADPASPWKGPFATNPPRTIVDRFEVDHITPGGLYKYNASGGFDAKSITVEIEAQEIDDAGDALGAWTAIDTITPSAAEQREQRRTDTFFLPSPGRWQVRERRTDAKDPATTARHDIQWVGLRGRLTTERRFPGVTLLEVRMKATGDLNNQTSRQVNVIATRKLPTWDEEEEAMTETVAATRSPCDGIVHIARSWNPDHKIDLAGIYANKEQFAEDGWTFDYVFDSPRTTRECLQMVARSVVGVEVEQGGKICLVLDRANDAPAMAFTPHNIRPRTFSMEFAFPDEQTADGVRGNYIDTNSWKPVPVTVAFEDSPQKNVTTIGTEGITNREQLRAVLWNRARESRYRRVGYSFGTEMEGGTLLYGDSLAVSHDLPSWGQAAEVLAWDAGTRTLTLSERIEFTAGVTHAIGIRDRLGLLTGPFTATDGGLDDSERSLVIVGEGELPEIFTGGDRMRTIVQFGPNEEYAQRLKVVLIDPQDERTCEIGACDDDPRMYAPLPDDDEDTPADPGAPTEPLDIHITANTGAVNLRSVANANGYTGNPVQEVTITIDEGVSTGSIIRGTWPVGAQITLINLGIGSGAHGGPSAPGGTALDSLSGPMTVDNTGGVLRGGGGGAGVGGQGGKGGDTYFEFPYGEAFNGATAQGGPSGSPGQHLEFGGYYADGGAGGAPGANGATGDWGQPGTSGAPGATGGTGSTDSPFNPNVGGGSPGSPGSPGGAAGKAVVGNANITWVGTGTRIGAVT